MARKGGMTGSKGMSNKLVSTPSNAMALAKKGASSKGGGGGMKGKC